MRVELTERQKELALILKGTEKTVREQKAETMTTAMKVLSIEGNLKSFEKTKETMRRLIGDDPDLELFLELETISLDEAEMLFKENGFQTFE